MESGWLRIIIILAVVGVGLYLFNVFVTMDARFKSAINAIVGLVAFIFVIKFLWQLAG